MNVLFLDCVCALYKLHHRSLSLSCSLFSLSASATDGFQKEDRASLERTWIRLWTLCFLLPIIPLEKSFLLLPLILCYEFCVHKWIPWRISSLENFYMPSLHFPFILHSNNICMEFCCNSKTHPIYMSSIKKKLYLISSHRKPYWKNASKFHRKWTTSLSSFALLSFLICCIMILVIWIQPC